MAGDLRAKLAGLGQFEMGGNKTDGINLGASYILLSVSHKPTKKRQCQIIGPKC